MVDVGENIWKTGNVSKSEEIRFGPGKIREFSLDLWKSSGILGNVI